MDFPPQKLGRRASGDRRRRFFFVGGTSRLIRPIRNYIVLHFTIHMVCSDYWWIALTEGYTTVYLDVGLSHENVDLWASDRVYHMNSPSSRVSVRRLGPFSLWIGLWPRGHPPPKGPESGETGSNPGLEKSLNGELATVFVNASPTHLISCILTTTISSKHDHNPATGSAPSHHRRRTVDAACV